MTVYRPVLDGLAGLVLSFIACFILLVIAPLPMALVLTRLRRVMDCGPMTPPCRTTELPARSCDDGVDETELHYTTQTTVSK